MWQAKVHQTIARMCMTSYLQANTKKDGTRYAIHRPYAVPVIAQALVAALGQQDEERCKALLLKLLDTPELGRE